MPLIGGPSQESHRPLSSMRFHTSRRHGPATHRGLPRVVLVWRTGDRPLMAHPTRSDHNAAMTTSERSELLAVDAELAVVLRTLGYSDLTVKAGVVCGVKSFAFTTGLVVSLDPFGYERRYCYEHEAEARYALAQWDGTGHPGGRWIKCKGAGIDLVNPAWSTASPSTTDRPHARRTRAACLRG